MRFHQASLASVTVGLVVLACTSSTTTPGPASDAGAVADSDAGDPDAATAHSDGGNGGPPDAAPNGEDVGWQSGTRLRAVVDTAGSARAFVRWHDTQLDVDCTYGQATDGTLRCLPTRYDLYAEYDDDHCTNPMGLVPRNGAPVKYLPPPNAAFVCGAGTAFHAPGAVYTPAARYTFDGSGCVADTSPVTDVDYVHFGALIPPSTFMGETEKSDPRGARLSAYRHVGDDGSIEDFAMLDGARAQASCDVSDDGAGTYYCTPRDRAYLETFFSDAACTTAVAFHPEYAEQVCGRVPTAVQDSTGTTKVLTFFEAGTKVTTPVHEKNGAACPVVPATTSDNGTFYTAGAPLPLASLASLTVQNEGTGRIQLAIARTESGGFAASLGFFDAQMGARCRNGLATDGAARCIPDSQYQLNAFTDAQCTQALFMTSDPPPAAGTLMHAQAALSFSTAVLRLAAKVATPATYWQWNGTTCESTSAPAQDSYATTLVAPSDLVAVTTAPE